MIGALLDLVPRWVLVAALVAVGAFAGVEVVKLSAARGDVIAARDELGQLRIAVAESNARAAAKAAELQAQVTRAQNEATKRESNLRGVIAAAGAESDGLRGDLAAMRDQLTTATRDAAAARAVTVGAILQQCAKEYQGMAAIADRHANDVRTLMDAWPK